MNVIVTHEKKKINLNFNKNHKLTKNSHVPRAPLLLDKDSKPRYNPNRICLAADKINTRGAGDELRLRADLIRGPKPVNLIRIMPA